MPAIINPGTITGLFSLLSAVSVLVGKPALGAVLSDPATANAMTTLLSGILGGIAGHLPGTPKP